MKALDSLRNISTTGGLFNILREVDLRAVQLEAEQRFSLLILGDYALTQPVAETLCVAKGEERAGYVHPWLTQAPFGTDDTDNLDADLALLLVAAPVKSTKLSARSTKLSTQSPQTYTAPTLDEAATQALANLARRGVPAVVIFIGAEDAEEEVPHKREAARVRLGRPSAPTWRGDVEAVLVPAVLSALPSRYHLSFARHLPRFRDAVMRALIDETSRANAIYATSTGLAQVVPILNIPISAADMVVLTKNQLIMAYKVALVAGKKGQPQEVMGELIGVLGGGFLFRQVARQLIGLVPVWGIVPKVAVSYAGTWAIGQSVQLWATRGKVPDQEDLRGFYDAALERGRAFAKRLTNRKEEAELEDGAAAGELEASDEKRWRLRLPNFRRTSPKVSPELPPSEEDSS